MDDLISREQAIDALREKLAEYVPYLYSRKAEEIPLECEMTIRKLPSAESETARIIIGRSMSGMTMWYQCDMCNEPVDEHDSFCRGCGRKFVHE